MQQVNPISDENSDVKDFQVTIMFCDTQSIHIYNLQNVYN